MCTRVTVPLFPGVMLTFLLLLQFLRPSAPIFLKKEVVEGVLWQGLNIPALY